MLFCKDLVKYSLYPFDSLRSLRVTAVGRVFFIKVPKEDSHLPTLYNGKPPRKAVTLSGDGGARWNRRSRMGITLVWL